MVESDDLRDTRIALTNGSGALPALGFGTLIPYLFRATRVKYLSRHVGWDSEPTHFMAEWESEELEATLTAVGVAVDQE